MDGWRSNPGAKSAKIDKIFARVKDHMVEKGTATAIVAIHDRESGDDAGTQLAFGALSGSATLLPGGSDDRDANHEDSAVSDGRLLLHRSVDGRERSS